MAQPEWQGGLAWVWPHLDPRPQALAEPGPPRVTGPERAREQRGGLRLKRACGELSLTRADQSASEAKDDSEAGGTGCGERLRCWGAVTVAH
eukprot:1270947-Rhodomonas_salina.1